MAFRMVIESQPDLTVAGEAANGLDAVAQVEALRPDVVLMDVRMPELDGVEATRRIVDSGSDARMIILTTFDLDEYVYAALRAGASGFLLKDAQPADLLSAIRAVASGDAVVAPSITRRLLDAYAHRLALPGSDDPVRPHRRRLSASAWSSSPRASTRSCCWSRAASPTPRSPSGWCSPRRRSSRTSAGSSPSSTCATACRSSSSPTRAGWSRQPEADVRPDGARWCRARPASSRARRAAPRSAGSEQAHQQATAMRPISASGWRTVVSAGYMIESPRRCRRTRPPRCPRGRAARAGERGLHGADRELVVEGEDRGRRIGQRRAAAGVAARPPLSSKFDSIMQRRVGRDPGFAERGAVAAQALLGRDPAVRAGDRGDPAVAELAAGARSPRARRRVRGRNGRDALVGRHARVDDRRTVALLLQRRELVVRLLGQDQQGAVGGAVARRCSSDTSRSCSCSVGHSTIASRARRAPRRRRRGSPRSTSGGSAAASRRPGRCASAGEAARGAVDRVAVLGHDRSTFSRASSRTSGRPLIDARDRGGRNARQIRDVPDRRAPRGCRLVRCRGSCRSETLHKQRIASDHSC